MAASQSRDQAIPAGRTLYTTPKLQVFGSLAEVTAKVGSTAAADGGHGSMSRSAP